MTAEKRREIVAAVDEAMRSGARQWRCCEVLSLCERRLERWRKEREDRRMGGYRARGQRLSTEEYQAATVLVKQAATSGRPLRAVYAEQLDEGRHVASPATLYRIRKALLPAPSRLSPCRTPRRRTSIAAEAVNRIWCWDITPMRLRVGLGWCYFYAFLDLYSRKLMAYTVEVREDGLLARDVLAEAIQRWIADPAQLTVHSDNGSPMKHEKLVGMLQQLQVRITRGRPNVSDDNAFIESLFATFKSRASYPEYFGNLDEARGFCARFVEWYNSSHRHSRLDWLTPNEVYEGRAAVIQRGRNEVLEQVRASRPNRFGTRRKVFSVPSPATLRWVLIKN
jgi:transposase InsO family protein